jgi:D-tyrosyl-tRNA(Tyr) deacylase
MRAVLQRVSQARVTVAGETVGQIGPGLLALVGVAGGDTEGDGLYIADKIADLRLFDDEDGKINRSVAEQPDASVLVISQFTLLGDCRKGRRPSWSEAAAPDDARRLYEFVAARLGVRGIATQTGRFGAEMAVSLVNDGPVTVLLDSTKRF